MADFPIERFHEHPYAGEKSKTHAHFRPAPIKHPPHSAAALPFRWMVKPVVFGDPKQNENRARKSVSLERGKPRA